MPDLSISNRLPVQVHPTACGAMQQAIQHLAQGKPVPGGLARAAGNASRCAQIHLEIAIERHAERQVAAGLKQVAGGKLSQAQIDRLAKIVTTVGGPGTLAGRTVMALACGDQKKFAPTDNLFLRLGGYVDQASFLATHSGTLLEFLEQTFPRLAPATPAAAGAGALLSFVGVPLTMNGIGYARIDGERRAGIEGALQGLIDVMRCLQQNPGFIYDAPRLKSGNPAFPEAHFGRAFGGRSEAAGRSTQPRYLKAYDAVCKQWYEVLKPMSQEGREAVLGGFKEAMQTIHGVGDLAGIERALRQKAGL